MLNRVLPRDIRVLDWAPVAEGFSARFDCQTRTYRYYFPQGSLDVAVMAAAAKRLVSLFSSAGFPNRGKTWKGHAKSPKIWGGVSLANRYEGTHDFRNVCKMDVGNGVLQFERTILSASVEPVARRQPGGTDQCDIFMFEITGLAFLYHQVQRESNTISSPSCVVVFFLGEKYICFLHASGTMHDGAASPDWTETGGAGDHRSAAGCGKQPQEASIQVEGGSPFFTGFAPSS